MSTREPRRRGRRTSGEDTRAALLDAARVEFAGRGYDGATVRRIGERAGVDPAMVNHWFGSKAQLFTASLEMDVDPSVVVAHVLQGDREHLGERIVAMFLQVWDVGAGGPLVGLLRSAAGHPPAARMLREFLARTVLGPLAAEVAPDRPDERSALVASQLIGMGMIRYVVGLEPLASADAASLAATVGPTLQRYLTDPLP